MKNRILLVVLAFSLIFCADLILSEFSNSGDLFFELSTDRPIYQLNETVRIQVTAPENTSTNLTIQNPSNITYTTQKEKTGSFTHIYTPDSTGNYSIQAFFSLHNQSSNISTYFTVTQSLEETIEPENQTKSLLKTSSLTTNKPIYLLNETVRITITAPENTTTNLTIQNPLGELYSTLKENFGSFTHLYIPEFLGDYLIHTKLSLQNETKELNTSFEVISNETKPPAVEVIQRTAELYKPVSWVKKITIKNNDSPLKVSLTQDLPPDASNIQVHNTKNKKTGAQTTEQNISGLLQPNETNKLIIEYTTPAPYKEEQLIENKTRYLKQVDIKSDSSVHYTNVKAYTDIEETLYNLRLYHLINETRIDVTVNPVYNVTLRKDRIYWIVPQLSNQSFEVEADLTVINIQSYPTLNGNWTVRFETKEQANLKIAAVDGTYFGSDLEFLEIKCGNTTLSYEWINGSVFISNYSCNETGYEISKVLTTGRHTLQFRFGSDVEYAHNLVAENITFVPPTPENNTYRNNDWVYINITSDENLNQSLLEWGNSTGYYNISMTNSASTNWYINISNLPNYAFNYTLWAQNTTSNWIQTARRFVTVDTANPIINFTSPTPDNDSYRSKDWVYVNVSVNDTYNTTAFIDWNHSLIGWWRFNEGSGNITYDYSTYGNNGTTYFYDQTTISSCDSTTDWQGTSLSLNTTDKMEGSASLVDAVSNPNTNLEYEIIYNETGTWNWTGKDRRYYYIKSNVSSGNFTYKRLYIYDSDENYGYWDIPDFTPNTWWTDIYYALDSYTGTGGTDPNLSSIDYLRFVFNSSTGDSYWIKLDWIYVTEQGPVDWGAGKFGSALQFDGFSDYLDLSDHKNDPEFNISQGAIEMWFNPKADNYYSQLLNFRKTGVDDIIFIREWRESYINFYGEIANVPQFNLNTPSSSISAGTWSHLVFQQNGSGIEAYINGEKQNLGGTGENSTMWFTDVFPASVDFRIGHYGSWADGGQTCYFNGTIDEVRIWNRSLTPEEINASYNAGIWKLKNNYTSLVDGIYEYTAYAQDLAGNVNQTEIRTLTVDTTPPEINFTDPTPEDDNLTSNNWAYINVSVVDLSPTSSFIDWNRSLVGYWSFEHVLSNGTVYDNSTYGNDGVMKNFTYNITVTGKFGNALEFDGIDSYVEIQNSESLNLNGALTLETWVYPQRRDDWYAFIAKDYEPGSGQQWKLCFGGSSPDWGFSWWNGTLWRDYVGGNLPLNEWSHIACAISDSQIKCYRDGSVSHEFSGVTIDIQKTVGGVYLSAVKVDGPEKTKAILDEVRIWNRALSAEEINASYNSGIYQLHRNFTNLTDSEHRYYAYSIDLAGNSNKTETMTLTVDTVAPHITLNSPENITYNTLNIDLNWTYSEALVWCAYSVNHTTNTSFTAEGEYIGESFNTPGSPYGITQNKTYFWIIDAPAGTIKKYWMNGTYTGNSFGTNGSTGITQDGTYFWVVHHSNKDVHKYWMNGTYTGEYFNTTAANDYPNGITQNGTYFWITDWGDGNVYKYWMNGTYTGDSFSTDGGASGITQDRTYIWVTQNSADEIDKYYMNGTYAGNFDTGPGGNPVGVTQDGTYFWITNWDVDKVYKYYFGDFKNCINKTITCSEGANIATVWGRDDAGNVNSSTIYFTIDLPPTPVTLLTPTNNSYTNNNTPEFDWTDSTNISTIIYHLQIDDSADFLSLNLNKTGILDSNYTLSGGEALPDGTYYWRVRANNSAGSWGNWSENGIFRVTVDTVKPTVTIIVPENNSYTNDNTPLLNAVSSDNYSDSMEYSLDSGINESCNNATSCLLNLSKNWVIGSGGGNWSGSVSFENTTKESNEQVILEHLDWWNFRWNYRINVTIDTTDYIRTDYPIEYIINFTKKLSDVGCSGCIFDNNSVRVIEYNATGNIIYEISSQFDETYGYNSQTNAVGEVVWILNGTTPPDTKKYFYIYFDTADNIKNAIDYSPSFTTAYNPDSNITLRYNGNIITVVDIKTGGTRSEGCARSNGGLLQLNTLNGTNSIDSTQDWIIPDEYLAWGDCGTGRVEPYALLDYKITTGPVRTIIFTQFNSSKPTYVNHYNFTWTFYSGENTELKGRFNWTVAVNTSFSFGNFDWPRQIGVDQSSGRYDSYSTGNTTGVIGACIFKVDASDRYDSVFDSSGSYPTISFVTTQNNWSKLDLTSCIGGQKYLLGHAIDGTTMTYSGVMNNLWWFQVYPGIFDNTKTKAFSDSVMSPLNISSGNIDKDKFYPLSGNLTSLPQDAESLEGIGSVWKQIKFDGTVPAGTNVSVYVNMSTDNTTWSNWVLVKENASPQVFYELPTSNQTRYGSWKLVLETNDSSITPEISSVSFGASLIEGLHNVTVYAQDLAGNLNYSIVYFTIDTHIDLTLSPGDIISPNTSLIGQLITVTATIHNTETCGYDNFGVSLLVDGTTHSSNTVSVGGNTSVETHFYWTAVDGTHNLTVIADPDNSVTETNESNNNATKQINVTGSTPPSRKHMTIYTNGDCVNETVSITLIDEDSQDVADADIEVYYDGSKIEDKTTNSQGETSFIPREEGTYEIFAEKTGCYDEQKEIDVTVCETCSDGVLNQDESDVDCGGVCPPCGDNQSCQNDADCSSGWCLSGECRTSTCSDGLLGPGEEDIDCGGSCPTCETCTDTIQNQDETDIDCGGVCSPCSDGSDCITDSDCTSGWCLNGTCSVASCTDGVRNQDESDVDCGGGCPPCSDGSGCNIDGDCTSGWCFNGSCVSVSCSDGVQNQDESDIDCGGSCPPCGDGSNCITDSDCTSGWCLNGTCNVASCSDGVQNQDETDVDCGGVCSPCGDGLNCSIDSDCVSNWCLVGVCTTQSCFDGVMNQDESSIDCGGICLPCTQGESCAVDDDCLTGWCFNGSCMMPSCFDGFQNQDENGIDCDGSCLPCHCFNGSLDGDEINTDCGGSCPPCGCFNEVLDGDESDVDCGGSCPACVNEKSCQINDDCVSGWCFNGVCTASNCFDGIKGPGEDDIDCGGSCLPCHCFNNILDGDESAIDCGGSCPPCRTIRVITNETTSSGETVSMIYNASSICLNNRKDKGESDIDCGGHCPPCSSGETCEENMDCLSGFCYEGVCKISSCDDGLEGPEENKIDCGGPCGSCPWIKVETRSYLGEELGIVVMNPRTGLLLRLKEPNGKIKEYNITKKGLSTYQTIQYQPNTTGLYLLELEGYDERYVNVKNKPVIPGLEKLPEEIRSLLLPLLAALGGILFWKNRRTKVVVDESAIKKFIKEDMLDKLTKKYREVYTVSDGIQGRGKLVFIELSDSEMVAAEDLSDQYSIMLTDAKTLILCKKLKAKKVISDKELPEEIRDNFKGTKIVSTEKELEKYVTG